MNKYAIFRSLMLFSIGLSGVQMLLYTVIGHWDIGLVWAICGTIQTGMYTDTIR